VDEALAEIERNRGVLYDPDVVDACIALFRVEQFAWDG
jgi:response regulator RpfG family c-di-GMP phosphodiesterase